VGITRGSKRKVRRKWEVDGWFKCPASVLKILEAWDGMAYVD
jgi:hypothetical protein